MWNPKDQDKFKDEEIQLCGHHWSITIHLAYILSGILKFILKNSFSHRSTYMTTGICKTSIHLESEKLLLCALGPSQLWPSHSQYSTLCVDHGSRKLQLLWSPTVYIYSNQLIPGSGNLAVHLNWALLCRKLMQILPPAEFRGTCIFLCTK